MTVFGDRVFKQLFKLKQEHLWVLIRITDTKKKKKPTIQTLTEKRLYKVWREDSHLQASEKANHAGTLISDFELPEL